MSVNMSASEDTSRCNARNLDTVDDAQDLKGLKKENLIRMFHKLTLENKNLKRVQKEEISRLETEIVNERENAKVKVDEERANRAHVSLENRRLVNMLNDANIESAKLEQETHDLKGELMDISHMVRENGYDETAYLKNKMAVLSDSENSLRESADGLMHNMSQVQGRAERAEGECRVLKMILMFGRIY